MFSVEKCDLPESSLLLEYRNNGAYTDCYTVQVDQIISQTEYIRAFYTTIVFKAERKILKWAVSKPSTDEEASLLAEARAEKFAAWNVEARQDNQILLSDFRGRTRSWLMSEPSKGIDGESTRLYFGSAVVRVRVKNTGERRLGKTFGFLIGFHRLYSRILLSSAKSRLCR